MVCETTQKIKGSANYSREPSCEEFFRQAKQKPPEIPDGFPRIFMRYDENKPRSFGREEYLELP